jgi:hypothetical protein
VHRDRADPGGAPRTCASVHLDGENDAFAHLSTGQVDGGGVHLRRGSQLGALLPDHVESQRTWTS